MIADPTACHTDQVFGFVAIEAGRTDDLFHLAPVCVGEPAVVAGLAQRWTKEYEHTDWWARAVSYVDTAARSRLAAALLLSGVLGGCILFEYSHPSLPDGESGDPGIGDGGGGCISGDPGDERAGDLSDGSGGPAGDGSGDGSGDRGGDSAGDAGEGDSGDAPFDCPADMVPAGTVCIDRYEASRRDATIDSKGTDQSMATSRPGVLPWYVSLMDTVALQTFADACAAAGKRLCSRDEWQEACDGPNDTRYVFGSSFDREVCNCVDTFCDDYCVDNDIDVASCNTNTNCGYACGTLSPPTTIQCFHVMPTGSFPGCVGPYGAYDVNGNVWEIVPSTLDGRGYEVRGGAFNCAMPSARLQCTFNASWPQLFAGFRCCKDPS